MQTAKWKMAGLIGMVALLPACQSAADPAQDTQEAQETQETREAGVLGGRPVLSRDGAPGNACDAEAAAAAVGEPWAEALLQRVLDAAGADEARALEEDSIITKEYKQGRVNVVVTGNGRVVEVYCG